MLVEYDVGDNPLRDLLVHDPVQPAGGELPVPKGPGLGLRLNPEVVARFTVG
jgi:D-galactarolactone cycloisomerase